MADGKERLSALSKWPRNYHKGNVDAIVRFTCRFGWRGVLCTRFGKVYAGNHSLTALEIIKANPALIKKYSGREETVPRGSIEVTEDGDWLIPVADLSDLSEKESEAFAVGHNHIGALGEDDQDLLRVLLQEIQEEEPDALNATGYSPQQLLALIRVSESYSGVGGDEDDGEDMPEAETPKPKTAGKFPDRRGGGDKRLFPLAIVLTKEQHIKWDDWKRTHEVNDDTAAFLELMGE